MMLMQTKFFEGELQQIEDKFNEWSNGTQYISETSLHFKGKDRNYAVLQVVYGVQNGKEKPSQMKRPKGGYYR
jgi:hypothetical protein